MELLPTYIDAPTVFSSATTVEIPAPTIDNGYAEGTALPTEHYSWLMNKITSLENQLKVSTNSMLQEFNAYLVSRSVTPSVATTNQFLTALAAQISGATVANATNAVTAGTCTGNAATATTAADCTGNAATVTDGVILYKAGTTITGGGITGTTAYLFGTLINSSGVVSGVRYVAVGTDSYTYTVPSGGALLGRKWIEV